MPRSLMAMQDAGSNLRDWVVVLHVPDESRELTLLVENPSPAKARHASPPFRWDCNAAAERDVGGADAGNSQLSLDAGVACLRAARDW